MADIVSREQRSKNMSAIRSKDTKPEIYIRHLLFSHGYRYRKNCSSITGCPDIYLAKYKTAIFINGCFGIAIQTVSLLTRLKAVLNFGIRSLILIFQGIWLYIISFLTKI